MWRQTVLGTGDDVDRAGDVLRHAFERDALRHLARFFQRRALGAYAECVGIDGGPALEARRARVRPGKRHAGLDPSLERRGARRVITAQRHAPDADAPRIDIAARLEPVDHRLYRPLVFGA